MHWADWEVREDRCHEIRHLMVREQDAQAGIDLIAELVPRAYADPARVSRILRKFGKEKSARYLENKLPTDNKSRSGDLGEIVGASFVSSQLGYHVINRLWWKDHRNMAMRGDDLIGIREDTTGALEFLKGEVKSRLKMTASVIKEADDALCKDNGRPAPHSLSFIADRLYELDEQTLSDRILEAQLSESIQDGNSTQLLFTFSGNSSMTLLETNTEQYRGQIKRFAVGIQIPEHQSFIRNVFEKVIEDARKY